MPSQKEKDRRITAAKKRLTAARDKQDLHAAKAEEASRDAEKAMRDLDWLRSMPVDDEPVDAQDDES